MTIERKVALALTAALVILLAIGAVSLRSTAATVDSAGWVAHTEEVLATLEATVSDLVDLQTGARGYIITGDTTFLKPYATGLGELHPHLEQLHRLTADNPVQRPRLLRLDSLAARAESVFAQDIQIRRSAGFTAARAIVLTRVGKSTMEAARALVSEMAGDERTLLAQRTAQAERAANQARLTAWLGALTGLLVGVGAAWTIGRDFAGRRRIAADLVASEARFRAVAATANDAIVSADDRGVISYFNAAAERIFGYTAAEVAGQPLTVLMPERFRSAHSAGLSRYLGTGDSRVIGRTVELAGRRKDGVEFPLDLSLASWQRGDSVAFTAIIRDITDRKQIEIAMERQVEELVAVNTELESFSYSVSHDLRAPLRAIDGFSRMLEEDHSPKLDAEARRLIGVVRANAARMGRLIDDLLQFARVGRQQAHPAPIDMTDLVQGVVHDLTATMPQAVITVHQLPGARGDVVLLRQVWTNLVGNALKYSAKRPYPAIEIGATNGSTPGEVGYFVRDNGVGFDMKYAHKLFGVFERLHRGSEFDGTGVGLAIVQRIVHRHGGRIWADGEPDKGATFYFTLPLTGA